MGKMSIEEKTKKVNQVRESYINNLTSLIDIEKYNGYIHYTMNSEKGIITIYEMISFLLKQDEEFKRKYEPAVKNILDLTNRDNRRYYEYTTLYEEDDINFDYDYRKIGENFARYLTREEWNSPGFSAKEAVCRHLKNYMHEEDPDRIMDYLLCLLREATKIFEHNKWAVKLSEIEQIQEKLISEEYEEKKEQEETKRCLAAKYIEILSASFNGEKISDDDYYDKDLVCDLIDDCGSISYEIIKNLDNKEKVNGITLKQFVISEGIHYISRRLYLKHINIEELYTTFYDDKDTGKYEIVKSMIVTKNLYIPDEILNTIDDEMFIKILNEIEIDESNIGYLLNISAEISIECVRNVLQKVQINNYPTLYSEIVQLSRNNSEKGLMYIELLPEIKTSTDEYNKFLKELLEKTFISTFNYSYTHKELNIEQLSYLFSTYTELQKLKELIYNTILLDDRWLVSSEYITKVIYAYWTRYCQVNGEEIELNDFADEFLSNIVEKRQIKEIQKNTRGIFNYTGSDMYETVYEDDKVKLSYLDGINGLYVEKKGPKYNEERYYLYPAINEEADTFIAKRTDVLPKDLLEELTSTENDTAFNLLSFRTDHYTKYLPNKEVSDKGWPVFTKESYINLTGDDSLSDEEAYKKTCKIISSNPVLKRLIKVDKKVLKKEANQ